MGNCIFKGLGVVEEMVKVVTYNGGVMELYAPITAECITNEFPGYGLFPSPHHISPPLLHHENLSAGQYYYLLPLHHHHHHHNHKIANNPMPTPPYRISSSEAEVLPRYNSTGVWKVRLVISPDQLSEILSQEARTEALIESVRTVAKCGGTGAQSSTAATSDHRSWTTTASHDSSSAG